MKTSFIPIAVSAGLPLPVRTDVQALPPRQHPVNGVIETPDCASRTIRLRSKDGAARLTCGMTARASRRRAAAPSAVLIPARPSPSRIAARWPERAARTQQERRVRRLQ